MYKTSHLYDNKATYLGLIKIYNLGKTNIIPILQMKKMRLRQVKWVFQGHTASTWQKWDTKSKVKFFHTYLNPRIKNITAFSPWLKSANNGLWKMKSLEGKQNKNLRDNHRSFIF